MKGLKLAAALLLTVLFHAVCFAQPSYKDEAYAIATIYDWTGFYAGVNVGAVNHTMSITDVDATTFLATLDQVSNPKLTGGFQLGYRQQLDLTRASGVIGIELSANFSNAKFSREYGSPFALYQLKSKHELKEVVLLEAVGGIAADRTFLFLAAGMSWTNISGNVKNLDGIPFFDSFGVNKQSFGTALGIGIDYAITDNITARVKVDSVSANTYTTHDNIDDAFLVANRIIQSTFGVNYLFK